MEGESINTVLFASPTNANHREMVDCSAAALGRPLNAPPLGTS